MARKNRVQFQKGLSWGAFLALYGTEELCRTAVQRMRWPDGFRCPGCGGTRQHKLKRHSLMQCGDCRRQVSLTSETIFHGTKLGLLIWFRAIYLLTQSKNGISTLELGRQLGVSQNTAWKVKHKLMQVMLERDAGKRLRGLIQMDDAFLGGARHGGKRGRGAPAKVPLLAAVRTTDDGRPIEAKLTCVSSHSAAAVGEWAAAFLEPDAIVATDSLGCFNALDENGYARDRYVVGRGHQAAQHPAFLWVNTVLSNVKTALSGTYHAIHGKHAPRYLAEFQYRFNRRFALPEMMQRLLYAAVRTPPMPMSLLKLAEARW